ncbi:hypothetical protein GUITHDRAFT_145141 [Guillardia theta CCMP2712]|uniref:Mitochondrial carrier protein n=2 Tax=Guillardia theta TaxID=55529 RepID=L1ILN5_GUITC|nr:hypothetical protein GUITHDRAFT_145141 [Guillardia theta CCMP2712]EKX37178.1 hypothetical protein GUITHDRAFT_145141 [Guillardia theta CCMP2712]|eukprot:XP_005824158.1 hypothetical protein GUITHDRAFT_145141 [Guillardia theta CCMP2712]
MYAGYLAFLMRDIPFDVIEFGSYAKFRELYSAASKGEGNLNPFEDSMLGAIAGGLAGAATTPLDVLMTRLMLQAQSSQTPRIRAVLTELLHREGPAGLFKGIGPRIAWLAAGGLCFFAALEQAKHALGLDEQR